MSRIFLLLLVNIVPLGDAAFATECLDLDNDGWGWNGFSSCRSSPLVCVDDSDGDNWG